MCFVLGGLFFLISFLVTLFPIISSPLPLVLSFLLLTCLSAISGTLVLSDFVPYIWYIVYVGGLLVLLIYMTIVSTNPIRSWTVWWWIFPMCVASAILSAILLSGCIPIVVWGGDKSLLSGGSLRFNIDALIILVTFLFYVFIYVCESIRVGGRALDLGNLTY